MTTSTSHDSVDHTTTTLSSPSELIFGNAKRRDLYAKISILNPTHQFQKSNYAVSKVGSTRAEGTRESTPTDPCSTYSATSHSEFSAAKYIQMTPSTPPSALPYCHAVTATRLLVLPLPAFLADVVYDVTKVIVAALPKHLRENIYCNPKETFHVTVFHFARPDFPVFLTKEQRNLERETAFALMNDISSILLQPTTFTITEDGTLLLLYQDKSDYNNDTCIDHLRVTLKRKFPYATSRTFGILHTSLCRVLSPLSSPDSSENRRFYTQAKFTSQEAAESEAVLPKYTYPLSFGWRNVLQSAITYANRVVHETLESHLFAVHFPIMWYIEERWHATIEGNREVWLLGKNQTKLIQPLQPFQVQKFPI